MKPVMKNLLKSSLVIVALSLAACTDSAPQNSITTISGSAILASGATPTDKAEELGKAAEQLLSADGYVEAHQLAEQGLQQDPQNLRCGFIKALTEVFIAEKGVYARIRPLTLKSPEFKKNYDQALRGFLSNPKLGKLKPFFTKGAADIREEKDLQNHLDQTIASFENLRTFARTHVMQTLTISVGPSFVSDLDERYAMACEIKPVNEGDYQLVCPEDQQRHEVTLTSGDFQSLQMLAGYFEMFFAAMNAYDLTGSIEVWNQQLKDPKMTTDKIYQSLLAKSQFGKLRGTSAIRSIQKIGLEVVLGLSWVTTAQKDMCSTGTPENPRNRPGKLFNKGLCLDSSVSPYINKIYYTFYGYALPVVSSKGSESYTANTNYMAFFSSPAQDLRDVGLTFDACGGLTAVTDTTLRGVFPNGDANKVLPLAAASCGTP